MSSNVFVLQVSPSIPPPLQRLDDLAKNFWFSWNAELGELFGTLDPALWRKVEGSPRLFLRSVDQSILEHAAADPTFTDAYRRIVAAFDDYLGAKLTSYDGLESGDLIAYFCAEYGWHESFPIYSGGLGVLAGDHCKTASDLRLPFVAVGLLYRQGYFHQRIDRSGQQVPDYPPIDPRSAPRRVGTESRWQRGSRRLPRPRQNRRGADLESGRRARHGAAARYGCAGERGRRSADHGQALRRQQRAASATGSGARHRRRARAASAQARADRVAHQRGARRVHDSRACARVHDGRLAVRGCARGDSCRDRVHDSHARQCRSRRVSPGPHCAAVRELSCGDRHLGRAVARARPRDGTPRRVQHDAARAARLRGRQRRQQDPRAGVVAVVRECVARRAAAREPRWLRHERRARVRRSCAIPGRSCSISISARTGATE